MAKAITIYCEVLKNNEWIPSDFGFGYDEKGVVYSRDDSYTCGLLGAYSLDKSIKFIEPLHEFKLPKDISSEAKQYFNKERDEDHCIYGWHTLTELLDFDWEQLSAQKVQIFGDENNKLMANADFDDPKGQFVPYKIFASHLYSLLNELKTKGLPKEIRIIYWVE
jgi:hypothetical protein